MKKFNIASHQLVPEHIKLNEEEMASLLKKYNISKLQLPKILKTDPAIKHLDPKMGDVIKIIRKSPTTGKTEFFRLVING